MCRAFVGASGRVRFALPTLLVLASASAPAAGQEVRSTKALPGRLDEAVGVWQFTLAGTERQCRLSLSIENGRNGRQLTFPATCRQTLPILGRVAGWFFLGGDIRLVDGNIRPVLTFSTRDDGRRLTAQGDGGGYTLVPIAIGTATPIGGVEPNPTTLDAAVPDVAASHRPLPGAEPTLPSDRLLPLGATVPTAPPPNPAPQMQPAPGIYAVDRFSEKDVCRIELSSQPIAARPDGSKAARILPGCRDNGIAVFDPVAWRLVSDRMVLRARKGHAISLVATADQSWRRDPDTGVTLMLRKVE